MGTAYGNNIDFITSASAPTATTGSAGSVTTSSATLNGTVNPNGASTAVTFEYGTTTSYGSTATATPSPLTGTTEQSASAGLTGLAAETTYHFRVKTTNSAGTGYGNDASFTTSYSSTRYVNKDGYCGGEPLCYTTIQDAINTANTGEAIMISADTYDENITLDADKSLTLIGSSTGTTTLRKAPKALLGSLTLQELKIQPE